MRHHALFPTPSVSVIVFSMVTTYKLDTRGLESAFSDTIRNTYPVRVVEIEVREQSDWKSDETEYLLSSPANRERMERILKEDKEGKLITFETLEQAIQAAQQ
jgi:hypothetical protein